MLLKLWTILHDNRSLKRKNKKKQIKKSFFLLHSCFIALPLSKMVYVQGAGLKTSYDNTSCYGPLFEENHVPGVSHHLPRITPRVALFPGSVLSVWTSKSFSAEPNFPLLTLRITVENECIQMLQLQMESPDVIALSAASNTHQSFSTRQHRRGRWPDVTQRGLVGSY